MYFKRFCTALFCIVSPMGALAQTSPFESGWLLDNEASVLNFVSVKKGTVMEQSRFDTVSGEIDETGLATVRIPLDSIDTSIDLRNVRMRFLLFQTFEYPEAIVTAQLTPDMLSGLTPGGTARIELPVTLDLHGVRADITVDASATLHGDNNVTVSSRRPFILHLEDFNLLEGLGKLEEAAEVTITPSTAISFALNFDRNIDAAPVAVADAGSIALEPQGPLTTEACQGRFEILTQTRSVTFEPNSAVLTGESQPVLNTLRDIILQCEGMNIEVAGHTDSIGSADYNLSLSRQRADAVVRYLVANDIASDRLVSNGFGEAQPIASNDTADGRSRNRRITFSLASANQI